MVSTKHCSPKAGSLKVGPTIGMVSRVWLLRAGEEEWGDFDCPGPALGSTAGHVLLTTFSKI